MAPYVEVEAQQQRGHSAFAYIYEGNVLSLLTAPVIYSLLVPLALLDAWVTIYQCVCFPIYGIARVRRRAYFIVDRHKLTYLNGIERVNCTFCSYANGVINYTREVAACTEQYWCPIKHARVVPPPHVRYHRFFDYGNAEGYRRGLAALRRSLRPAADPSRRALLPRAHRATRSERPCERRRLSRLDVVVRQVRSPLMLLLVFAAGAAADGRVAGCRNRRDDRHRHRRDRLFQGIQPAGGRRSVAGASGGTNDRAAGRTGA